MEGALAIRAFRGRALLADEMGLGKSLQALFYSYKCKSARPIVIICPASLKYNWQREASMHLDMASEVLSGTRPPRSTWKNHAPILIINYEILESWLEYLIALSPQIVIWDEAHYVQNRLTIRFHSLRRLLFEANVPHRIAISGTPLTNRPAELWSTLHLLLPEEFASFVPFAFEFCKPKLVNGKWDYTGAKNLRKLHLMLRQLCMIRRTKAQVATQLPPKMRSIIPLELSPSSMREYTYASEHFLKWLRERHPAKVHRAKKNPHLTRVGYLLRLCAFMKRKMVLEWVSNFYEESEEKLVIFSGHRKMIRFLEKHFSRHCVVIDGSVTGKKRQWAVDRFNTDPKIRFAICNPKAAGVGLNMTSASNVLYCDFPWAPGVLKQGEDRIHRIGQKKRCFIWYLAVRDTLEEKLCKLLQKKQAILDEVMDGKEVSTDFDVFQELLRISKPKKDNQ